jgi:hypothetical protein
MAEGSTDPDFGAEDRQSIVGLTTVMTVGMTPMILPEIGRIGARIMRMINESTVKILPESSKTGAMSRKTDQPT